MTKGVVAGGSGQTAEAGAEMLRAGGNAVDAAVAAAFACFVAECSISTLGGCGFATVYGPDLEPVVYDFFGTAPGLGREGDLPDDLDFTAVPVEFKDVTEYYHVGRGSSIVPGNLAGLAQLLAEAGTLPLATVLEPAIRLAREGLVLSDAQGYLFTLLGNVVQYAPNSAAIFAPGGELLQAGDHFANPAFAETLEYIAQTGWDTLYTGELAAALVDEHRQHGGLITARDLAEYRVIKRPPLRLTYREWSIYTNPPPSLGGILIAYGLGLLGRFQLDGLKHGGAAHVRLLAEIMRASNDARRDERPDRLPDPVAWDDWLSPARLDSAWKRVKGRLWGDVLRQPVADPSDPRSTTHISALDADGLAVGITVTPGETGGYAVGETGLLMNNMLGEAVLNPDGFHQWEPGARLSSMMSPTIVMGPPPGDAGGEAVARMVIGSGGGSRLRGAILQGISNLLDWDLAIDAAANRSRVHFEHGILNLEAGFDPVAADMLAAQGYDVQRWTEPSLFFGGVHLVGWLRDGRLDGAGDRRRGGAVVVVE